MWLAVFAAIHAAALAVPKMQFQGLSAPDGFSAQHFILNWLKFPAGCPWHSSGFSHAVFST
jgi:hypothetical protein